MQYLITKSTGILGFCRGRTLKLTESHSIITQHIGHGTGRVNPLRVRVHTRAGQGTGLWACTRGKPVPDPRTRGFKRSNLISRPDSDPGRRSTVSYKEHRNEQWTSAWQQRERTRQWGTARKGRNRSPGSSVRELRRARTLRPQFTLLGEEPSAGSGSTCPRAHRTTDRGLPTRHGRAERETRSTRLKGGPHRYTETVRRQARVQCQRLARSAGPRSFALGDSTCEHSL